MSISTFFKLLAFIFWAIAGIINFYVIPKIHKINYQKEIERNENLSQEQKFRNYQDERLVDNTLEQVAQAAIGIGIVSFIIFQAIDYANAEDVDY